MYRAKKIIQTEIIVGKEDTIQNEINKWMFTPIGKMAEVIDIKFNTMQHEGYMTMYALIIYEIDEGSL